MVTAVLPAGTLAHLVVIPPLVVVVTLVQVVQCPAWPLGWVVTVGILALVVHQALVALVWPLGPVASSPALVGTSKVRISSRDCLAGCYSGGLCCCRPT